MDMWEEFDEHESDDPVIDLDRLVDLLIEQYGLSAECEEAPECNTTH